jgi:CRISPR-associated endoribonuclease Cas6
MPVRFRLALERTAGANTWPSPYMAAYCLRGALVPYLRDAAGLDGIHGHRYSIHLPALADTERLAVYADLCLLSDNLAPRAHEALQGMHAQAYPILIGDIVARVSHVSVAEASAAAQPSGTPSFPAQFVDIAFLSVTTFAAGNRRTRAVPDPALIVKSWSSSWNGIDRCPQPCRPEVIEDLSEHLEPIDGSMTWGAACFPRNPNPNADTVHAPYTMSGFIGTLTLRLHRSASSEAAHWLSRLAWLAGFAGTGYHAQIGFGATRAAARSKSAGPRDTPKPPSSADAV